VFVTRAEIEERHASRLSDIVRNLPGVRIDRRGARGATLRFNASANDRRDCFPQYWVDGQVARGADIDDFPPGDVHGIELYSGPAKTPLAFSSTGTARNCGTVVIWTKAPG
jgi:hypothetical protein